MTPKTPVRRTAQTVRRRLVRAVAAGLGLGGLGLAPGLVQAQAGWPSRPLRLLVGFPPGSSPDLMARTLADPLAQALGQPVRVDNRPGAGGNVAAEQVARADDGHTLGLMINGNLTTARILNPATPYDPLTDLAPVSLLVTAPLLLVAGAQVPGDAAALLAAGRAAGTRWNYGSPGVGTLAHLGMEMLAPLAGWQAVHVPFPGNPQVITALIQGHVQVALLPPGLALPQVQAGKLVAIGLTSTGRSSVLPQVPSLAELGLPGFQLEIWNAVAAPARMDPAHILRVSAALAEIVRRPEIRQRLFAQGWQVAGTAPEGLAHRIRHDTARMREVIERHRIRPQ
jgi:tripartite-type tricarboxylate transporter receptor subunit TctC